MKEEIESVTFKENYIFITLFVHVVIGSIVSLMPEENVLEWFMINMGIAIVLAILNLILWIFHKHDSKRYFSLHSFVMIMGGVYYAMSPAFKALYPTVFFWILLAITIGLTCVLFLKREFITRALVNPRESWFKGLLFYYMATVLIIGAVMWAYILAFDGGSFFVVAIIFYFIGLFLLMVAPALLATREQIKELKQQ
ncbi:hypothetical protein D1B33_03410 [Lysinibacillus yapensis]|uniref:Uncharacterized protein n=1 Tax=Ureibacillus yapensis TaxID=2304605 RepID=A0A396SHY3_9BACL|nr:hypothetical protein [Lysinibacillus yapensis]RHW39908.1 hypothetical protein D1B33_03410 [Lysinibacillus yapensis]